MVVVVRTQNNFLLLSRVVLGWGGNKLASKQRADASGTSQRGRRVGEQLGSSRSIQTGGARKVLGFGDAIPAGGTRERRGMEWAPNHQYAHHSTWKPVNPITRFRRRSGVGCAGVVDQRKP
jgi:hypothetical protein